MLEQLAKAKPAVVIDGGLFTSPDRQSGTGTRNVEPVAPLARAAAGLGHINLEVDSDGIMRSVARYEGDAHSRWPQLTLPVAQAVARGTLKLASAASGDGAKMSRSNDVHDSYATDTEDVS